MAAAIAVAAFGPYVMGGVKTDQIVVYGLFPLLLPIFLTSRLPHLGGSAAAVLLGWLVIIAVGTVQLVAPPSGARTQWGEGSWVANLEGFTLSLATLVVALVLAVDEETRARAVRRVAAVVVVAMSLNTLVAVVASRAPARWASMWWSSVDDGTSGADRAANAERYVGLINQAAAAGILYGFAGMCALLWLRGRPLLLAATLLTLAVGGFLAVSKAFIFVGLPVVLWHFARQSGGRTGRIVIAVTLVVVAWETFLARAVEQWSGAEQFARQVPTLSDVDPVAVLTGNRYGGGNALSQVVGPTMDQQPWFGFGMSGVDTATDAGWVQVLVVSGIVGVVALLVSMSGMVSAYLARRGMLSEDERRFFAGVLTIAVVVSFGFPIFTGNRVAVIFWLLLGLLLMAGRAVPREPAGGHARPVSSRAHERAVRGGSGSMPAGTRSAGSPTTRSRSRTR